MKLVVALWNPEKKYWWTRHSIGAHVVLQWLNALREADSEVALTPDDLFSKQKNGAALFSVTWGRGKVFVLFPSEYMNDSGRDVAAFARMKRIASENILVVHDDKDMDLGKIRFVKASAESGNGGHNGVKSVMDSLSTKKFARLKIGVANELVKARTVDTADFVLDPFSKEEKTQLPEIILAAAKAIEETFLAS